MTMIQRIAASAIVMAAATAALPAGAATFIVQGDTSSGIPVFNRPLANGNNAPTTLSGTGTAVAYSTFMFSVTENATYSFALTAADTEFDTYLGLYANGFNPSSPLANAIVYNDDAGGTLNSAFSRDLVAGVTYTAVVTGFENSDRGVFTLRISDVAAAVPEPATWGMMLVGFGMVGAAARYRRRRTAVTFA